MSIYAEGWIYPIMKLSMFKAKHNIRLQLSSQTFRECVLSSLIKSMGRVKDVPVKSRIMPILIASLCFPENHLASYFTATVTQPSRTNFDV